jgi:hypothetical protein
MTISVLLLGDLQLYECLNAARAGQCLEEARVKAFKEPFKHTESVVGECCHQSYSQRAADYRVPDLSPILLPGDLLQQDSCIINIDRIQSIQNPYTVSYVRVTPATKQN